MKINRLSTEFGYIDYHYSSPNKEYPNGLLLFMGSHIEKESRGKGYFKNMVKELFLMFPENTLVQAAVANKN